MKNKYNLQKFQIFETACLQGNEKPYSEVVKLLEQMCSRCSECNTAMPKEKKKELGLKLLEKISQIENGRSYFQGLFKNSISQFMDMFGLEADDLEPKDADDSYFFNATEKKNRIGLLIHLILEFFMSEGLVPTPLVLFLDDFQSVCEDTAKWLESFFFSGPNKPDLLLVLATRGTLPELLFSNDTKHQVNDEISNYFYVKLLPLSSGNVEEYLLSALNLDISAAALPAFKRFAETLHEKTLGNPLVIKHLLTLVQSQSNFNCFFHFLIYSHDFWQKKKTELILYNPKKSVWSLNFQAIESKINQFLEKRDQKSPITEITPNSPQQLTSSFVFPSENEEFQQFKAAEDNDLHILQMFQRKIQELPKRTMQIFQRIAIAIPPGRNICFEVIINLDDVQENEIEAIARPVIDAGLVKILKTDETKSNVDPLEASKKRIIPKTKLYFPHEKVPFFFLKAL